MNIETYLKTAVAVLVLSILGAMFSMLFLSVLVTKLFVCAAAAAWAALLIGGVFSI